MTIKTKKTPAPKVWRGRMRDGNVPGSPPVVWSDESPKNCTVIPDGSPIPFPPAVRRLLAEALKLDPDSIACRNVKHEGLLLAAAAYRKSIAKGAKK
jgi:hypothetical protein